MVVGIAHHVSYVDAAAVTTMTIATTDALVTVAVVETCIGAVAVGRMGITAAVVTYIAEAVVIVTTEAVVVITAITGAPIMICTGGVFMTSIGGVGVVVTEIGIVEAPAETCTDGVVTTNIGEAEVAMDSEGDLHRFIASRVHHLVITEVAADTAPDDWKNDTDVLVAWNLSMKVQWMKSLKLLRIHRSNYLKSIIVFMKKKV